MLKVVLLGILVIVVNLVIQAFGNVVWIRRTVSFFQRERHLISNRQVIWLLISSFLFLTLLHIIHSIIWAICYFFNPLTNIDFSSFSESVYFSLITFTTLGYGDIILSSGWRLLSGLEAINGIMLIGWSTALMFSLIQNIYKNLKR